MPYFRLIGIAAICMVILTLRTAWILLHETQLFEASGHLSPFLMPWIFQWLYLNCIPLALLYAYQPNYSRCGLWPLMLVSGFIALNPAIIVGQAQPNTALCLALLSWALAFTLRAGQTNQRIGLLGSAFSLCIVFVGVIGLSQAPVTDNQQSIDWIRIINAQQPFLIFVALGILASLRQGKAALPGCFMLLPSSLGIIYLNLFKSEQTSPLLSASLLMLAMGFFLLWQLTKIAPLLNNFSKPNARWAAVAATLLLFSLQINPL
jgi:hypothetical protein